jgi:hypothetical protein
VNHLIQKHPPCNPPPPFLFLYAFIALLGGCTTAATFEGMIPTSFETVKNHPQTVRVNVNGGQETEAIGRPQITDSAFTKALVESITKSQTFSKVIEDRNEKADYLLTVTLFSMVKRVFGRTVQLEAGWTLRRADTGDIIWQESVVSESTDNLILATESAARKNIAQGLAKISKLNL